MFLGHNEYIFGRFGGHLNAMNTSTQSGGLINRLNVSTRVPTEVTTFLLAVWTTVFKFDVEVEYDVGVYFKERNS
jgi:hypothetical protein